MNSKLVERVWVVVCLVCLWVGVLFLDAPNESVLLEVFCPQQM